MGMLAQKVYFLQGLRSESMTTHLFLFCIDWLPFRVSKGIYKSIDIINLFSSVTFQLFIQHKTIAALIYMCSKSVN